MRAILALLCLFCGSPDDVTAESFDAAQERKVEKYRAILSDLVSSSGGPADKAPIDLPEGLREAIETWTDGSG
jgi:hypothetical protein